MTSFKDLGLSPHLLQSIQQSGYTQPYPIQSKIIPIILKGKDVMGIAPTGSGKTAAFIWPLLEKMQHQKVERNRIVRSLIIVPTRELAVQIDDYIKKFSNYLRRNIESAAVYGGVSISEQMKSLRGKEIIVGTPGRLLELVDKNAIYLSNINHLIIDEADKLFQLGFEEEMKQLVSLLPNQKQVSLFSATLNEKVEEIKDQLEIHPKIVSLNGKEQELLPEEIEQLAFLTLPENKGPFLRYFIKTNNINRAIIFVSSQRTADNLLIKLKKNKFSVTSIHGKKSQSARLNALSDFKNEKYQFIIATDLIARGIDIEGLENVINFELPRSPLDFIHRIGRTGRAGNVGKAYTILTEEDLHHFNVIQKKMKKKIEIINHEKTNLHGY